MRDTANLPGAAGTLARARGSALLAGLPERHGFGDATLIRHQPDSISLGGGDPDLTALPLEQYRVAVGDVTDSPDFAPSLRYTSATGSAGLRELLAQSEQVPVERILITNGGAHGLALGALGLLDPGDTVVVDDPVYPLFLRTLDLVGGVRTVPIRVEADGLAVDDLEAQLRAGLRPAAVFTVPDFQNPSGVVLSEAKRNRLVELAQRFGFYVLADNPYRELHFPGVRPADVTAFNRSHRVLHINTFSKTLGPGLRLGWLVLPEDLLHPFTKLRNRLDGQTSSLLQEVVTRIPVLPDYRTALEGARELYARKARLLVDALQEALPGELEFQPPQGGYFSWVRFRDTGQDFARLFDLAQDEGVFYQRGEWFSAGGEEWRGHLRLTFSTPTEAELVEGVRRLGRAYARLRSGE